MFFGIFFFFYVSTDRFVKSFPSVKGLKRTLQGRQKRLTIVKIWRVSKSYKVPVTANEEKLWGRGCHRDNIFQIWQSSNNCYSRWVKDLEGVGSVWNEKPISPHQESPKFRRYLCFIHLDCSQQPNRVFALFVSVLEMHNTWKPNKFFSLLSVRNSFWML